MSTFVYILKSEKDKTLYIGITYNIRKRILDHNLGLSKFTKGHLPYKLLFTAILPNRIIAARFEKYLKSASGKAFINKRLINI